VCVALKDWVVVLRAGSPRARETGRLGPTAPVPHGHATLAATRNIRRIRFALSSDLQLALRGGAGIFMPRDVLGVVAPRAHSGIATIVAVEAGRTSTSRRLAIDRRRAAAIIAATALHPGCASVEFWQRSCLFGFEPRSSAFQPPLA